jgi:hypothetical protein
MNEPKKHYSPLLNANYDGIVPLPEAQFPLAVPPLAAHSL